MIKNELKNIGHDSFPVYIREDKIISIITGKILSKEDCEKYCDFIHNNLQAEGNIMRIIIDNTALKSIDDDVKILLMQHSKKSRFKSKIATFGDSISIRSFIRMFISTFNPVFKLCSFLTEKKALTWLKQE